MYINFHKYQGTGNDFILIDNRPEVFPKENEQLVALLCDRHMGIGADGLILLENDEGTDFRMVYYNSDGKEGSMCGNGGRCIVAFAKKLGLIAEKTVFRAVDGIHEATLEGDWISLQMQDVNSIKEKPNYLFMDTGSPHHVQLVDELNNFEVKHEGRRLRYSLYGESGSNINFVSKTGEDIYSVRTYERGVEDETLSCGTGVTAVAIAMHHLGLSKKEEIHISTRGGNLEVTFHKNSSGYTNVKLIGPAKEVFKGTVEC